MPASTFEIISRNWVDEDKVFSDIALSCKKAELFFLYSKKEIIVKLNNDSNKSLIISINTQKSVDWYLETYPAEKEEPEERIPYYVYNSQIGKGRFYSIALANNYLDEELIWRFSIEYLKLNKSQLIGINEHIYFNYEQLFAVQSTNEFREGIIFGMKKS